MDKSLATKEFFIRGSLSCPEKRLDPRVGRVPRSVREKKERPGSPVDSNHQEKEDDSFTAKET